MGNCDNEGFVTCHHFRFMSLKFTKFERLWNIAKKLKWVKAKPQNYINECNYHLLSPNIIMKFPWISLNTINFILLSLINEYNLLLCMNIAVTYIWLLFGSNKSATTFSVKTFSRRTLKIIINKYDTQHNWHSSWQH